MTSAKVRPLIDHMNKQCKANFVAEQVISIDECMVPYYGKHGAKQYIHGKPIKFGYKLWVAATTLGYVIQFLPYQGAGTTEKELGLGGSVVKRLAESLPKFENQNYHLVFDNLFTSPQLLYSLKNNGFAATGTLRANRTMKAPLKSIEQMRKLDHGAMDAVADKTTGIHLVRWNDNKVVTVASNVTGKHPVVNCRRFSQKKRERISLPQPQAIHVYNKGVGGVDRCDQNIACYMISLRTKKVVVANISLLCGPW